MKPLAKLAVFIVLLALPFGGRWLWFHRGGYTAPEIEPINDLQLPSYMVTYQTFTDQPQPGNGRVVIDLYHDNNLAIDDLTPLRDRLAARGVPVTVYNRDSESLEAELSGATALVVLVPAEEFSPEERRAVEAFVMDGGRLLLGADPTRPVPLDPDLAAYDPLMIFFAESAVPAINSLANDFGISYFEDYLYNLEAYEGNYRNVRFGDFATNDLTAGLDEIVCFAGHSIKSDGTALFQGDDNTLSDIRTGETGLTTAAFSADGRVLALGDVSFLMAPYHLVADNDHFLSNLADWLATSERDWDLADFPYLYQRPVAIVQMLDTISSPALVSLSAPLQAALAQANITATLRVTATETLDTLYLGDFEEFEPAAGLLLASGVTVTLQTEDAGDPASEGAADDEATPAEKEGTDDEEAADLQIVVENLGTFETAGAQLFVTHQNNGQTSMVVLAEDRTSLVEAVDRLVYADFSGCLAEGNVMLCVSSSAADWSKMPDETPEPQDDDAEDGEPDTEGTPTPDVNSGPKLGSVFILSVDEGPEGMESGAVELELALSASYEVTIWTVSEQGYPESADLEGYDAYIVTSGDFSFDEEDLDRTLIFGTLSEKTLYIGEQILPPSFFLDDPALLSDLEVTDSQHPLAAGFSVGQSLALSESFSGVPALVFSKSDMSTGEADIVFSRGAASEAPGAPVVIANESNGVRLVLAGFAFYRLSETDQALFANNVIAWLMGE